MPQPPEGPLVWILHRIELYPRPRSDVGDNELEEILRARRTPNAIPRRFAWCWTDPHLIREQIARMRLPDEGPPSRQGRPRNAFLKETDFGPAFRVSRALWAPSRPLLDAVERRTLADSILRDVLRWGHLIRVRREHAGRIEHELPWVTPAEMRDEVWSFFRLFDRLP